MEKIVTAVVASLVTSLIMWFVGTTKVIVDESNLDLIANRITRDEAFRNAVINSLSEDIHYEVEMRQIEATNGKNDKLVLGSTSDYLIWTLGGKATYRHGKNGGRLHCNISIEQDVWMLEVEGGNQPIGVDGADKVWCNAIGLKIVKK